MKNFFINEFSEDQVQRSLFLHPIFSFIIISSQANLNVSGWIEGRL
ncbi:hypothetical protein [Desertivirga arenae]|nr:hypothetical protein [Pedobacter sp. SYSU D00823]